VRRGPLRHRQFTLLFAGQAISAIGDRISPVALAFAVGSSPSGRPRVARLPQRSD
jgi:hypothetical protein